MAVIQSDFSTYAGKYYEGQLIDNGMNDVITLIAEEEIKFGQPVSLGTSDKQCKPSSGATDHFAGIAIRSVAVSNGSNDMPSYKVGDAVSILRVGRVAVKVAKASVHGTQAGFKSSVFQGTSASGDVMIDGSYYVETGGAGDIVAVQLNGSNELAAKS